MELSAGLPMGPVRDVHTFTRQTLVHTIWIDHYTGRWLARYYLSHARLDMWVSQNIDRQFGQRSITNVAEFGGIDLSRRVRGKRANKRTNEGTNEQTKVSSYKKLGAP